MTQVYTPNAGDGLKRLEERQIWDAKYADYLAELDQQKPVLATGDYNVAHKEIDLANPASNRRSPGFTDEERGKFGELLDAGFIDTFRYFYPDAEGSLIPSATCTGIFQSNTPGGRNVARLQKSTIQDGELTTGSLLTELPIR